MSAAERALTVEDRRIQRAQQQRGRAEVMQTHNLPAERITGKDGKSPVTAAHVLSESSADVWARWSRDRERRDIQKRVNAELEAREAANLPIYPRECAQRIAEDMKAVAPDWRFARPTLGPAWGRLLKAQPELAPDLTRQREATITAVFNGAPRHMQEAVRDLRTLIDLLLVAHEAAAYVVGYEAGTLAAGTSYRRQERPRKLNTRVKFPGSELRLHLGEGR